MKARFITATETALTVAVTLFGLVFITFVISRVLPIDPVLAISGDHAPTAVVASMREKLGLDQSLPVQFGLYLLQIAHGDFGVSVMTSRPVLEDIGIFFPATFELSTTAFLAAVILGVPLGVLCAVLQNSLIDQLVLGVCTIAQSVPIFVLGLICLLIFYVKLGIAPGSGRVGVLFDGMVTPRTGILTLDAALSGQWDAAADALAHLALPASVLAFFSSTNIVRITRALMLETLSSEFVLAADARGLSFTRIVWGHAFRNVVTSLVTLLALSYASLLEGAIATETVFSWPGLGNYMTTSLLNADMNAVVGATLVVGAVYLTLNLLADLTAHLLDPRTR
jgi:peptide/nickel transport system permease protein